MTLTKEEEHLVLQKILRANIDMNQAIVYAMNSDYENFKKNILAVVESLTVIIKDTKD